MFFTNDTAEDNEINFDLFKAASESIMYLIALCAARKLDCAEYMRSAPVYLL